MYATIYTQVTTADMYSIPVVSGNKYQIVGQGWWTPYFIYEKNGEVPVLGQYEISPTGIRVVCEENNIHVHFDNPSQYEYFIVQETNAVTAESALMEIAEQIGTLQSAIANIGNQLNTMNAHLQQIESNTTPTT